MPLGIHNKDPRNLSENKRESTNISWLKLEKVQKSFKLKLSMLIDYTPEEVLKTLNDKSKENQKREVQKNPKKKI